MLDRACVIGGVGCAGFKTLCHSHPHPILQILNTFLESFYTGASPLAPVKNHYGISRFLLEIDKHLAATANG